MRTIVNGPISDEIEYGGLGRRFVALLDDFLREPSKMHSPGLAILAPIARE